MTLSGSEPDQLPRRQGGNTNTTENVVDRFLAAVRELAPDATQLLTAAAFAAASPALGHRLGAQQAHSGQVRYNTTVSEPVSSGHPPVSILLDLTNNVLVWLDEQGKPTYAAPSSMAYTAHVCMVGSLAERYQNADAVVRRRLIREPTRVLLSSDPAAAQRTVIIIRGAPGDPRGFRGSIGHPLNPTVSPETNRATLSPYITLRRSSQLPSRVAEAQANAILGELEGVATACSGRCNK